MKKILALLLAVMMLASVAVAEDSTTKENTPREFSFVYYGELNGATRAWISLGDAGDLHIGDERFLAELWYATYYGMYKTETTEKTSYIVTSEPQPIANSKLTAYQEIHFDANECVNQIIIHPENNTDDDFDELYKMLESIYGEASYDNINGDRYEANLYKSQPGGEVTYKQYRQWVFSEKEYHVLIDESQIIDGEDISIVISFTKLSAEEDTL